MRKTAEEILNSIYKEETKFLSSINTKEFPRAYFNSAIKAMKEYARIKCEEQRESTAEYAESQGVIKSGYDKQFLIDSPPPKFD